MTYREELIQVAAVVVSMLEDLNFGKAWYIQAQSKPILDEIVMERIRQDIKWGAQHHDPFKWLAILMEEVGEAAQAKLQETE